MGTSESIRMLARAVRSRPVAPFFVLLLFFALGCSGDGAGGGGEEPDGSSAFLFGIRHDSAGAEDFVAVTSDSAVIATARAQLQLPADERTLHIHGPIARGNGGHNLHWGWHFTPDRWALVQFSMERCDGNPSAVEADIDTWVDLVGDFCPWNSYVKEELP